MWDDVMECVEWVIVCDEGYVKVYVRWVAALRGKREYARARESLKVCCVLFVWEGEMKMICDVDVMVVEIDVDEV